MSAMIYLLGLPPIDVIAVVCSVTSLSSWTFAAKFSRAESDLGVEALDSGWTDRSRIGCIAKCLQRYPSLCKSVIYNQDTRNCIPGFIPSASLQAPSSGDLYTSVNCNKSYGFQLFAHGAVAMCALFPTVGVKTYDEAEQYCRSIDAFLPTPRNAGEKNLLFSLMDEQSYWLGIDDKAEEGNFVWTDNGQLIDLLWAVDLFALGQPNDHGGNQDCVILFSNGYAYDVTCIAHAHFLCLRES